MIGSAHNSAWNFFVLNFKENVNTQERSMQMIVTALYTGSAYNEFGYNEQISLHQNH